LKRRLAMRYMVLQNAAKDLEAGVLYNKFLTAMEKFHEELATAGMPIADERPQQSSKGEVSAIDYSEEAIPERDPAYRPLDDTLYKAQTVEVMPAEMRLALARSLEQLGMSGARAAVVANL
jgi:hypothetical protein